MQTQTTQTLAENIAAKIIALIQERRIDIGERIPTEMQLVELFGVSRTTIREAEKLLCSRNVLEIRQGAGVFVSPKRGVSADPFGFSTEKDRIRLAHDLMDLRICLETYAAELAAVHATRDDVYRLWENHEKLCAVEEQYALEAFSKLDLQFHTSIAIASHNLAIRRIIPVIEEAFTMRSNWKAAIGADTIRVHRDILEAIERKDPIGAKNNMIAHLVNSGSFVE